MTKAQTTKATKGNKTTAKDDTTDKVVGMDGKPTKGATDSQKTAKPAKKSAKTKNPQNKNSKPTGKNGTADSAGNDAEHCMHTPIKLDYTHAGKDPLKVKGFLTELRSHENQKSVLNKSAKDQIKDINAELREQLTPVNERIEDVYIRAAEKGITRDALDFAKKLMMGMSKEEYKREFDRRQMSLNLINV